MIKLCLLSATKPLFHLLPFNLTPRALVSAVSSVNYLEEHEKGAITRWLNIGG